MTRLTKGSYDPLTGTNPLPSDELNQLGGFNVKGRETPSYVFQVRRPDNLETSPDFPQVPLSMFGIGNVEKRQVTPLCANRNKCQLIDTPLSRGGLPLSRPLANVTRSVVLLPAVGLENTGSESCVRQVSGRSIDQVSMYEQTISHDISPTIP